MRPANRSKLEDRVVAAAESALAARKYATAVDILAGIGWLPPSSEKRWRQGQVDCLESVVNAGLPRISLAMKLFRRWAASRNLVASETAYIARTPARETLRFTKGGDPAIERFYRTHWISHELTARKRARIEEKAGRPPDLVAIAPLKPEWICHRCGATGAFLVMENPGPACLACVGLGDLAFVPAGDALTTRRAKAKSARSVVVVRWSRARKRYERQGILVEPAALAETERELTRQSTSL